MDTGNTGTVKVRFWYTGNKGTVKASTWDSSTQGPWRPISGTEGQERPVSVIVSLDEYGFGLHSIESLLYKFLRWWFSNCFEQLIVMIFKNVSHTY